MSNVENAVNSRLAESWKSLLVGSMLWMWKWLQRPFYPPTVPKALALTSLSGLLAGCLGYFMGADFATHAGFGLAAGSLLFALLGSVIQGSQITRINEQVHRVLFNDVTMRVFYNIQENEKLSRRMHEGNIEVKNSLGAALRGIRINGGETDFLGEYVVGRNVFIESGSTYAYLALAINEYLKEVYSPRSDYRPIVCTNNVLVFMVLAFQWRCRTRLYPGTPAGKYGATYGTGYLPGTDNEPVFKRVRKREMSFFLNGEAQVESDDSPSVDETSRSPRRYGIDVALMAASKLHLKFGPHVGSEENVCFKKALMEYCRENSVPCLMFIDASKIEQSHEKVGRDCRMLFDGSEKSPFNEADVKFVGKTRAEDGFDQFAREIGSGRLVLFVGYEKSRQTPYEIEALKKRLESYNAEENKKPVGACLVRHTVEPSEKVDLLIVYAEVIPPREDGADTTMMMGIQRAIATRVS